MRLIVHLDTIVPILLTFNTTSKFLSDGQSFYPMKRPRTFEINQAFPSTNIWATSAYSVSLNDRYVLLTKRSLYLRISIYRKIVRFFNEPSKLWFFYSHYGFVKENNREG